MTQTVLILGASGRFGRAAATAFADAGWQTRRFRRGQDDLQTAAQGADVIVNAWNVPYSRWQAELPGLTRQAIAAARSSGARLIVADNLYVYGAGAPATLDAATPHRASNPLGRLKAEAAAAYRSADVPVTMLRGGDFLDTAASGNWFDTVIAAKASAGRMTYPGAPDRPHAWAFLPDMARAAVALAERRTELAQHHELLFPGYTLTGAGLSDAMGRVLGRKVAPRRFAWWQIRLARPFWAEAKHLLEMRYLWNLPHAVDPAGFDALLPGFARTKLEDALRAALAPLTASDQPRPAYDGGAAAHPRASAHQSL